MPEVKALGDRAPFRRFIRLQTWEAPLTRAGKEFPMLGIIDEFRSVSLAIPSRCFHAR